VSGTNTAKPEKKYGPGGIATGHPRRRAFAKKNNRATA
tara:strand:- start:820 stop:933 length:114 start_codon:yes stop_codon:yes gene_type:complete